MKVTIFTDPDQCAQIIEAAGLAGVVAPKPGNTSCVGLASVGDMHILVENDSGIFTVHFMEECTKEEAFAYLDGFKQKYHVHSARIVFPNFPEDVTVTN